MDFSSKYFYFAYKKDYKKRHNLVNEYLTKKYLSNIYIRQKNIPKIVFNKNDYKIWVLWWQGEENMPPIVKICFNSLKKHAKDIPVILLTKDNFYKYIDLPDYILNKINKEITITHLSDIIRFFLLDKYGGLWIDATVLVTKNIVDIKEIFFSEIYTAKLSNKNENSFNIAYDRWTGFLMGNNINNNMLFMYGKDLFFRYWKENDILIDYFLIDYFINMLYGNNLIIRKSIDKIPINNKRIFELNNKLNKYFNIDEYEFLISENNFHKLSWKEKIDYSNKKNFYNYIGELYL